MARNGNPEKDPFERIDACIRNLQDRPDYWYRITRSPATREAALAGLVGELEGHHLPLEALDMRCFTIFAVSDICIKKRTRRVARLAYRAVGLLLLTLRDGSPGPLLDEAFPVLSKAIHGASPAVVVAAIDCLAAASFAGARHVERSMDAIWRVIVPLATLRSAKLKIRRAPERRTNPTVLVAAVSAWTFLLTTVLSTTSTQRKADRTGRSTAITSLMEFLDADDRRVRMAAGEALAVCAELNLLTGRDTDALVAKVSSLAAESASRRADNSLLREQKELFGQIAAFLDHDEPPTTSWEFHDMMKVSTWVRLVQLNFLRKFLGNGFLEHVQANPLLKEAFSFGRVEGKPLSIQNKGSSMLIDDLLRDLNRIRDGSWFDNNILVLPRIAGRMKCWPEKLLRLGWH
ncbi:unnamed protein product [Urochloa decumbens]|uniref:Interferon-related developmental regulator N-terminal domain-containing protein n=1 Tax=Urochloa decumbens TaxID=240449 RepID=A0ABC9D9H7_9POAL